MRPKRNRERRKITELDRMAKRKRRRELAAIELTEKQLTYLSSSNVKFNIFGGATGSGKTFLAKFILPDRIINATPSGDIAIIGNTRDTVVRNVIDPLRDFYGSGKVGTVSNSNTVTMFGRKVRIFGADKISNKTKIQGMNLKYVYCDEIVTWNEEFFQMFLSRLRMKGTLIDATCNPDKPKHWFKEWMDMIIEKDAKKAKEDPSYKKSIFYLTTTIDDARLDPDPEENARLIQEMKDSYSPGSVHYRRYMDGEWAAADGLCYRTYAERPDSFLISKSELPNRFTKITIGVDFGGSKSKHAFCATGYDLDSNSIYVLKSARVEPRDPGRLNDDFVNFLLSVETEFGQQVDIVYADSAEPVLIAGMRTELANRKIYRNIENAAKRKVNDRIRALDTLQCQNRFFIVEGDGTKTLRDAIIEAVYNGKDDEQRLDDLSTDIDSMDAFEYTFERDMGYLVSIHTV